MKNIIANALISNTATIGVHWIYDYKFLEKLSNKQSLLFMDPKKVFMIKLIQLILFIQIIKLECIQRLVK